MTENSGENALTNDDRTSSVKEHFNAIDIAKIAIQSANVGIWIIDTASQNFLPSNRTKELFGYLAKEEMSLENAMLQIVEKHRKIVLKAMETAFKERSNLHVEYAVIGYHDHQHRWLNLTGGFSESDASNTYLSGIVIDITTQKQNELRRSKFIGLVSHELKTPLTALKAYVQMLNNWAKMGIPLKLTMCSGAMLQCVPLLFDQGVPGGLTSCSGAN